MRAFGRLLGDIHDFSSEEAQDLLRNKFVVVIGDSIHRSIYKDLVYILQTEEMLEVAQLKKKGEETFAKDCRVEFDRLHSGTDYCEVRQYRTSHHLVRFYFITRVYSSYMESILNDFKTGVESGLIPDVLILNSCIWDLNMYRDKPPKEPPLLKAIREYRQNLEKLFASLDDILPSSCLVIWDTALPMKETESRKYFKNCTPRDVILANFYSASMACCYNFDVLDLHYCFRFLEQHLYKDGLHWSYWAHRCITKLLLTHMADAWGVKLQKRKPQIGIDWNGNIEDQHPSSLLPSPQTPRQPLPHASGSPFSQFNPSNNPFAGHNFRYGIRPKEGFESEQQPYVQQNAYVNGIGDRFEHGQDPQPHLHLRNIPYFQHNANYSLEPVDGCEYDQGPPCHPGHRHLRNVPHVQHHANYSYMPRNGSVYDQGPPPSAGHPNPSHESYLRNQAEVINGPMHEYGHEQCAPPYPGQLHPGHGPYFLGSADYANGPVDGYEGSQGLPPYAGPLNPSNAPDFQHNADYASGPVDGYEGSQGLPPYAGPLNPSNAPDFQHNADYANGPVDGLEDEEGPLPHQEEIPPIGFAAPGPNEGPWLFPRLPRRPPRRARSGRSRGLRMHHQPSRSLRDNAHPYARPQGGSRDPQQFERASSRGSRPWRRLRRRPRRP